MPHAKSAISHHFSIGIGLAFRHLGPALACALECLRIYSRPPFQFFCLRANSSVGSRDSVSLYLTGSFLGALSQRLFPCYTYIHAHPHHHTLVINEQTTSAYDHHTLISHMVTQLRCLCSYYLCDIYFVMFQIIF